MQHLAAKLEHGVHMGSPQVEVSVVKPDVKPHVNIIGHAHRQRCGGIGENRSSSHVDLVLGRRHGLALGHLGRALLGYRAGDLDGRLASRRLDGAE